MVGQSQHRGLSRQLNCGQPLACERTDFIWFRSSRRIVCMRRGASVPCSVPILGRGRLILQILCLAGALVPEIFGQHADPPKDLLVVEQGFRQALLSRDAEVLGSLLTDDFVRSPPNASPETGKFEYIEAIRAGKGRYFTIESHDAKYRLYGDVVLENVVWNVTYGDETNKSFSRTRALLVWVKQATGWKLASLQGNSAPEH